ncbi:MAG: hypothetical protein Tsb0014_15850 [Pleurocapsa sp.]
MAKFIKNKLPALEPEKSNLFRRIVNSIKSSPKQVTVGLTALTAIATLGYGGVQYLVKKKLPPLIETQLSKIINRPIDLGEVKGFSLGGIELGQTVIPATANDPDRVFVEGLKVDFRLLPLILRRTLPVDITLIQPDIYLEQEQNGEWINLNFLPSHSQQKSPIDFDVGVDVREGNITAIPYGKSAITVKITGSGKYQQQEPLIAYDLDTTINRANATIQGKTNLETGQTDSKLLVKDLALADLTTLLPNSPVTFKSGVLNADLDVDIPSLTEIDTADIKGMVSINNVAGKVTDLSPPIKADSELDFNGQNAKVKQTQASLGDIVAQVDGSVHLDRGYELDVNVLPFQLSSLPPEIVKQIPVEIGGELEAALQLGGAIKEPLLTGSINNIQTISIDRTQFKEIKANFRANLDRVVLETLEIIPLAGGVITADGVVETRIGETLADKQEIDATKMLLNLNFWAELPTRDLVSLYYQLPQQIKVGKFNAEGKVSGTINNLKALVNWQIPEVNSIAFKKNISGQGELLLTNSNLQLQNTRFKVDDGVVAIKAEGNLNNQNWRADLQANSLALNPFLTKIPNLNLERAIALQAAKIRLNGKLDNLNTNRVTGVADLNLDVDGSKIVVNSALNAGIIQGNINTNEINLNQIVAALPIPTTVRSSQTNFSGELQQLLNFQKNPNLNSFQANITADLNVAAGTVKAIARLDKNQWQAEVNAQDISSRVLLNTFAPSNLAPVDIDNLDAQIDVSGKIYPLINKEVNLPISINRVAVKSGEQYLNASGNLTLADVTNNLDIANTKLNINANLDLDRLPIRQILAATSENNQLVADSIPLQGKAEFGGQFSGQKLMSTPTQLDNLALTGDLRLLDFALNDVDFDSVMAGKININPTSGIDLHLQGQRDIIAAYFVPCQSSNCRLPYLPTSLEIRQGEDTAQPVTLAGKRSGDLFSLDIHHFPLALLNLAPGKAAGIEGILAGKTTGNIDFNLFTLATKGKLSIENPGVGYIKADKLAADFNYDPNYHVAQVTTASLNLGNSKYNLNAALDLQTGAIDGQLQIPEAYIQDSLATLRWFTLADAIALFNTPSHTSAMAVETVPAIDTINHSLAQKLDRLSQLEKRIQQTATAKNSGSMPTALDIQGKYTGAITLGGTLEQPEADFEIAGNNWLWESQLPFLDIVHPVGMFKEESQFISIDRILTKGKLVGNVVSFEDAKLQMEGALLSLTGEFSPEQQDAQLKVENLSLDTIHHFVNFPVDVAGAIALESRLTGTFAQPEVTGNITLANAAYNGNLLPSVIAGNFAYKKKQLKFTTTEPSSIQIAATVPYPPQETQTGDRLTLNAQLDTEALALLGIFTQESLSWIDGQGQANIQATANLNLNREIPLENLNIQGAIALNEAQLVLTNPFFTIPIIATGKINLKNQFIDVETLQGSVAGKDLAVKGRLPILQPVANIKNPLQVTIPQGQIDIERLYRGKVAGKIIVTSAAVTPTVSGEVDLTDGKIFFSQQEQNAVYTFADNSSIKPENTAIVTKFENFWLRLDQLKIQQSPIYEFALKGELLLNGTADSPQNIQPEGTLYLTKGNVNWLGGEFSLMRDRQNYLVFSPKTGMLNPNLNIGLKTEVQDFSQSHIQLAQSQQNEISDSLTRTHESDSVEVNLIIEGEADKLWSSMAQKDDYCRIRPNNASLIEIKPYYSREELNRHSKCFNAGVLAATPESSLSLVDSPAVELTSSPSRSEGEIIRLLDGELFYLVDTLENKTQSEIFDVGVNTFIIDPLARRVFSLVEDEVISLGKSMGLNYLGIHPQLEGVYEIQKNSSVRFTYNHGFIKNEHEVHLEYRFKF